MHIAEGYLPVAHCVGWAVVSAPFVVWGAMEVIKESKKNPENKLLLAAAGAFTFLLSAIKLPSVTGSSSHPTGTGLGAILFRPPVMAFMGTVVLIFQALLLAHGGLTTLGANVFSMAIAGPWAGYGVYKLAKKCKAPFWLQVFLCMMVADLFTYCVTSLQLALAYPAIDGNMWSSLAKFLTVFAVTQIPLAVAEGLIGVVVFEFLKINATEHLQKIGIKVKETVHA